MSEEILIGFSSIIILGLLSQWLAWLLRVPSIIVLLIGGLVAGPGLGLLNPDHILGDLLFPIVSLAVAIILFEGGLNLRISDLSEIGATFRNLVSIGSLVTWMLAGLAAFYIFDMALPVAMLIGAVLVVTGPTVIIPIVQQIKVKGRIGNIVKWEGIVNDPVGALLAVLVFEAILATSVQASALAVIGGIAQTIVIDLLVGGIATAALIFLLRRYWIPDHLQNGVTIVFVLTAFVISNQVQAEAGLFTVTLMGIALANQPWVNIKHIAEFKENLGVLLISTLFIILSARLTFEDLSQIGAGSVVFLIVLVLVVRPLSVGIATLGSNLEWREKAFLAWMAPRGIVAAAVTSVFALELAEKTAYAGAEQMVPIMFFIIAGTVAIYGLSAAPLGRYLKVAEPNPQGVLLIGAHQWAREIAHILQREGQEVLVIDTSLESVEAAKKEGLPAFYASVLSEHVLDEVDLSTMGRMLALTPSDEINALAVLNFTEVFGRAGMHRLVSKEINKDGNDSISSVLIGRLLFSVEATFSYMADRFASGAEIKKVKLTPDFDYTDFKALYGEHALPLFLLDQSNNLAVFTADNQLNPQVGHSIISLVTPQYEDDIEDAEDIIQQSVAK